MNTKKLTGILFLIFSLGQLQAQDFDGYYSFGLDINQPLSNTSWVNNPGIGFQLGFQRFINERFSLGADFNWGTYKKYQPTETFQ